jgi:hypothetical protein
LGQAGSKVARGFLWFKMPGSDCCRAFSLDLRAVSQKNGEISKIDQTSKISFLTNLWLRVSNVQVFD